MYLPGDSVLITDIGDGHSNGTPLVCKTTNVNTKCCRRVDGGNVGDWHHPNGTIVPRSSAAAKSDDIFTRNGFIHEVRLNRRTNAVGPLGTYTCIVPDEQSGRNVISSINVIEEKQGRWHFSEIATWLHWSGPYDRYVLFRPHYVVVIEMIYL